MNMGSKRLMKNMRLKVWCMMLGVGLASFSCSRSGGELDFNAQLKKDIATIDEYLAKNNVTAVKDSSGVRYVIQTQGTGAKPTSTSKVGVKYIASM